MEYTIGTFSELTGIGVHALRYYEKEHLITPGRRDNGRRCYTDGDIEWIEFIKRLKDTGMPIKEIRKYAEYRAQGNETLQSRMEMLLEHHSVLSAEIDELQAHRLKLEQKISYYKKEIEK